MDDFINVIRKDPQTRNKINIMLVRYNELPYKYQPKIGYDTLIKNVVLKELINKMSATITDIDIEIKLKLSRIKYFESRLCSFISYKWLLYI